MSDGLRLALAVGLALATVYLLMRQTRSKEISGSDLLEAAALTGLPLFLPGAVTMVVKALGHATLPIFNAPEDRLALVLGGAMLLAVFVRTSSEALRRAWNDRR